MVFGYWSILIGHFIRSVSLVLTTCSFMQLSSQPTILHIHLSLTCFLHLSVSLPRWPGPPPFNTLPYPGTLFIPAEQRRLVQTPSSKKAWSLKISAQLQCSSTLHRLLEQHGKGKIWYCAACHEGKAALCCVLNELPLKTCTKFWISKNYKSQTILFST